MMASASPVMQNRQEIDVSEIEVASNGTTVRGVITNLSPNKSK